MKTLASILILVLATGAAWAQSPVAPINKSQGAAAQMNKNTAQTNAALPASNTGTAKPAANTAAGKPASTSAKPATSAAAQKPAVATPASAKPAADAKKAAAKTAKPAAKQESKVAAEPAKPADAKQEAAPELANNSKKRDPFVSPIVSKVGGPVNCTGGKKCLVVDQIALKGVVRSHNGMIAVVENAAKKAYFMRENDPIYNGFVVKITPDSVVFRETVADKFGKPQSREVTKKVNAPAV